MDLRNRAFWMAAFGKDSSAADLIQMHPLRRFEGHEPVKKSPGVRAAESRSGWKLVDKFFSQKRG